MSSLRPTGEKHHRIGANRSGEDEMVWETLQKVVRTETVPLEQWVGNIDQSGVRLWGRVWAHEGHDIAVGRQSIPNERVAQDN